MVFAGLALAAMHLVLSLIVGDGLSRTGIVVRLCGLFGVLTVGAFTHEIGQFFAVVVAVVLAVDAGVRGLRGRAVLRFCLFATIFAGYQVVNHLDQQAHPAAVRDVTIDAMWDAASTELTCKNTCRYVLYTTVQPFVPSGIRWSVPEHTWPLYPRLILSEPFIDWHPELSRDPLLLMSCALALLLVVRTVMALFCTVVHPRLRSVLLFLAMPTSLFCLHSAATVLGRLNIRPESGTLISASYYAYLPLMMMLVGLFVLWAASGETRWTRIVNGLLLAAFVTIAVPGAWQVKSINAFIKRRMRPVRTQADFIRELVKRHQHDPEFRMRLSPEVERMLPDHCGVSIPAILFGRYINPRRATHVVCLIDGKLMAIPEAEYRVKCLRAVQ
jgi:hypothetical protein